MNGRGALDAGRREGPSSYSGGSGTECVETAPIESSTAVRDPKRPEGAIHIVRACPWIDLVQGDQARGPLPGPAPLQAHRNTRASLKGNRTPGGKPWQRSPQL
ncbi:DUF397 domain-containing protein [Streptomyces sp. MAG02]|nr:DUF397 domain-containing protein [Streptomyces sp. MAG02]